MMAISNKKAVEAAKVADHRISNGVTVQKHGRCKYCEVPIYIKTIQCTAPMLAPLTRAEESRQELMNITGEVYLRLPHRYCPICGAKMDGEADGT